MKKGYTLIELIIVVVILAVLAVVVLSRYINLSDQAYSSIEKATVGAVKVGIVTYYLDPARGNYHNYPSGLDNATVGYASSGNLFFNFILDQPVTSPDWRKTVPNTYLYVPTGNTWTYNANVGLFTAP
ncbi:MAG TPA: prepilin-type N-terminal cleavage/methylation domain-containing protein [Candidatus Omnitrophota bacterium]|nr:prepilin-type N-terminal cleavage/methylation domain-containing protein [Candidatus Omnitrophota bacterium]